MNSPHKPEAGPILAPILHDTTEVVARTVRSLQPSLKVEETGIIRYIGHGIIRASGLPAAQAGELILLPGERPGMVFNLDPDEMGIVLLAESGNIRAGDEVRRTGRVLDVPVGPRLLGRVVDPTGLPLDGRGPVRAALRRPIERDAPAIFARAPVTVPLQTGIKAIDATIPIGRGQRELIMGDRQTGKSAIALDAIINQGTEGVICVYCAIGQRSASVARLIADLQRHGAMAHTVVVVAPGERPPGLLYVAPYAATTIAEYFMEQGSDVLIVYDDLTSHARAYRELSLLLRRPPGREAFPGDIFYIHSRLLERATHLRPEYGGGSLTALPIVETEAGNVSAYIPTNLISITDGQIYLSPDLFQKGILPAVDIGNSVSRVGGKTQLPAYRAVAGDLRLSYSQFEELEAFARFGTRLDKTTRQTIERGRRVREALKQPQFQPMPVTEQIAVLLAVTSGLFDDLPLERIAEAALAIRRAVVAEEPEVSRRIAAGEKLRDADRAAVLAASRRALEAKSPESQRGDD